MALIQFSGLASGIDSASLITSLLDQERAALVDPYQAKVTEYEDQNSAIEELATLLEKLKATADKFRLLSGGPLCRSATSSNETVASAVAGGAATNGNYALNVTQLASNGMLSFNDRYSSGSDAIYAGMNDGAAAADRTVTVTTGSGSAAEEVSVELTSSTTLSEFVQQYNSQATKSQASIVNMGTTSSPSYAVVISSENSGTSEGQLAVSVGSAVQDGGAGAFNSNTLSQAKNAIFSLDGLTGTIERSSNTIGDVIAGVTFQLQATGSTNISVGLDTESTATAVQDFVDAYNDVVDYLKENNAITREENDDEATNTYAPLAKTSVDDNMLTALRTALGSAGISGGLVNILADLGITTERDGTLSFDSDTFAEALNKDPSSAGQILENLGNQLAATDGTIAQFTRFNGLFDNAISLNNSQITSLQKQISEAEDKLSQKEESLTARYARLEQTIGKLQSQQSSLSAILGSIS